MKIPTKRPTQPQPIRLTRKSKPPEGLDPIAAKEWRLMLSALIEEGIPAEKINRVNLATHCLYYSTMLRCSKIVQEQGMTYTTPRGDERPHPLLSLEHKASMQLLETTKRLGATPASRARRRAPRIDTTARKATPAKRSKG